MGFIATRLSSHYDQFKGVGVAERVSVSAEARGDVPPDENPAKDADGEAEEGEEEEEEEEEEAEEAEEATGAGSEKLPPA